MKDSSNLRTGTKVVLSNDLHTESGQFWYEGTEGVVDAIYRKDSVERIYVKLDGTVLNLDKSVIDYSEAEKLERVLVIAETSESSDAILLATEVRRLRRLVEQADTLVQRPRVTRVELIVNSKRDRVLYGVRNVATALQDDGRTLKIFLKEGE